MATVKTLYGTTNQPITCTITSLANATGSYGAGQASTYVDNTVNLFLDALVQVQIKTSASALANDEAVYVYAYGTANTSGPTFPDGITGTNAGYTATNPPNIRLIGVINAVATSTTYTASPMSVALAFGGMLPPYWGIYVVNFTGQTLDASIGSSWYQGIQAQSI